MSTMTRHEYDSMTDEEKIGLLQLLYHDIKERNRDTDKKHLEVIIAETQVVYSRMKRH